MTTKKTTRCPHCGYTEQDAQIHMDHHLCKKGRDSPPWRPSTKEETRAAYEKILRKQIEERHGGR